LNVNCRKQYWRQSVQWSKLPVVARAKIWWKLFVRIWRYIVVWYLKLVYDYFLPIPPHTCGGWTSVFSFRRNLSRLRTRLWDETLDALCFLRSFFHVKQLNDAWLSVCLRVHETVLVKTILLISYKLIGLMLSHLLQLQPTGSRYSLASSIYWFT